jgi:hypothetical protein
MGRRGRAKVETYYSWSERGARLEAIYREVLDELAHRPPRTDERRPLAELRMEDRG